MGLHPRMVGGGMVRHEVEQKLDAAPCQPFAELRQRRLAAHRVADGVSGDLLWLSVAPLVSGLVAEMFGTRYMATLLGIAFVMHQVGSSLGAWGGGLIFDAGTTNSNTLLQIGPAGSSASHASNPTSVQDVFFRIGGDIAGQATNSLVVNSNNTLVDDIWAWRADHGNSGTVGWTINTAQHGLVVNGNNVLATGLFVEHYQNYDVQWFGNGGETIFFQNEMPYDPPNQAGNPLHAIDRDRRRDRQAAGDRVTHGVEQRAGMRRAAQKVDKGKHGKLRRRQRCPRGHLWRGRTTLRAPIHQIAVHQIVAHHPIARQVGGTAHQESCRQQQHPDRQADQ